MTLITIDNVGQVGIIYETAGKELPPNAWTEILNFRTVGNSLEYVSYCNLAVKYKNAAASQDDNSPFIEFIEDSAGATCLLQIAPTLQYWNTAYYDLTTNGTVNGTNWLSSTLTLDDGLDFVFFHNLMYINNRSMGAYEWDKNPSNPPVLPPFFITENVKVRTLRTFKNYMVALDITADDVVVDEAAVAGNRDQQMVWWSDATDPGFFATWDYGVATSYSGRYALSQTPGNVIDCLALGDVNLIYKDDAVVGMTFVGLPYVFKFQYITEDFGIFSKDCVVGVPGGHLVLTKNDLILHDGTGQWQSVWATSVRERFFGALTTTKSEYTFLKKHPYHPEIWICYASAEASLGCDRAYVWNWETGSTTKRDLPSCMNLTELSITDSIVWNDLTSSLWSSLGNPWSVWGQDREIKYLCGANNKEIAQTVQFTSGLVYTPFALDYDNNTGYLYKHDADLQRYDIALVGMNRDQSPRAEHSQRKIINRLWLRDEGLMGGDGEISVAVSRSDYARGSTQSHVAEVFDYDPGSQEHIDVYMNGKALGIRIRIYPDEDHPYMDPYRLYGYDMDINSGGIN